MKITPCAIPLGPRRLLGIALRAIMLSVLAGAVVPPMVLANEGKVTFINNAQKAGRIGATIHFKRKDGTTDSCTVIGTSVHPIGTSTLIKASTLAGDIQLQCPHADVQATDVASTVKIIGGADVVITEIDVDDSTDQVKTINPQSLDDDKLTVRIRVSGTGSGGSATVSMDGCGSSASTSASGKTGLQVVQSLAAGLTNCDAAHGSSVTALDAGGGAGELVFQGLSNTNSVITFDAGGNFGLTDRVSMSAPFVDFFPIPTLSEWGLIALLGSLAVAGVLALWRK